MDREVLTKQIAQLRSTLGKMEIALGAVEEAIVWSDPLGRIQWCNRAFDNLVAQPHILILGKQILDLFPLRTAGQVLSVEEHPFTLALRTNERTKNYFEFLKAGELLTLDISSSSLEFSGDEPDDICIVLVARDVTESKQNEHKLLQANEELIRVTRLKDDFLANMSHELRTPLNAILGMAEGMLDGIFGPVNERQIDSLSTIENSGKHLLSLITDILDVSKIEAGEIKLDISSVSILYLCKSSIDLIKQQALQKNIQLNLKIEHNLPDLLIDERRMRQVLLNLLSNALKFTAEGGEITLQVQIIAEVLRISVSDNGIGIAEKDIEKLFQPFVQIDSALNRKYAGTGLGLVLVKRIVELHNGNVLVESQPDVGSCFSIELPTSVIFADSQYSVELGKDDKYKKIYRASELLLLAEDNQANVVTISSYLRAKGYRLELASNGQEAIDLARKLNPDLILMDIQMPIIDGLSAIEILKQDAKFDHTPIIALTALAMPGDRERATLAGASEYLGKPLKMKELLITIQRLLSSRTLVD